MKYVGLVVLCLYCSCLTQNTFVRKLTSYEPYNMDGVVRFYFLKDTIYDKQGKFPPVYWYYKDSYTDQRLKEIDLLQSAYSIKDLYYCCKIRDSILVNEMQHDIRSLDEFGNRDSMRILKKNINYSDNIYDTQDELVKVISFRVKGKALLFTSVCKVYLERINIIPDCPVPWNINKTPIIGVKTIENTERLTEKDLQILGLKKSNIRYIEQIFCD